MNFEEKVGKVGSEREGKKKEIWFQRAKNSLDRFCSGCFQLWGSRDGGQHLGVTSLGLLQLLRDAVRAEIGPAYLLTHIKYICQQVDLLLPSLHRKTKEGQGGCADLLVH